MAVALWGIATAAGSASVEDRAYELNREGMIAMSEARFTDAIHAFQGAADLVADYGVLGKPLMYTPVFMTGWAAEKIGRTRDACEAYRRYVRIAQERPIEPTKIDHAKGYIEASCRESEGKDSGGNR